MIARVGTKLDCAGKDDLRYSVTKESGLSIGFARLVYTDPLADSKCSPRSPSVCLILLTGTVVIIEFLASFHVDDSKRDYPTVFLL